MKIFEVTRIRMTIWYVLIIMAISSMFSLVIYKGVVRNIEVSFANAENRFNNRPGEQAVRRIATENGVTDEVARDVLHKLLVEELTQSKKSVLIFLLIANLSIFTLSTVVSYFLAGKTLLPIEEVIHEQKRFIADASHELKTPLTSLKTSIEVSIRSGKLPKDIQKLFQYNLEDVNALNELIDSLLSLATLENKKLVFTNLDINEVIQTAIKRVRYIADKKNIKIKVNSKNHQVMGDEITLTELFVILLDNAIKYNSDNGKIFVDVNHSKNQLCIKVRDTGIGINKKYLTNIFDRFYRIDSSRTCSTKSGYGLGLSMAKKIVENHGGTISVVSELTKGTTFTIKIPNKS